MEFTSYITPDNLEYEFDDKVDKFLFSEEGTGMPPIQYLSQRGPFQHGETIFDYRLQPRTITLVHKRTACNRGVYWDNRLDLINYIRPNRNTTSAFALGKLRKKFSDGTKYDIDVTIQEGPMFQPRNLEAWEETTITETLVFYAPDPTFYAYSPVTVLWTLTIDDELKFPLTIAKGGVGTGIVFGGSIIGDIQNVTYTGTWFTYPTIVIVGPLNGPVIRNLTTGEEIRIDYTVNGGDILTVSLPYGNKTVTNSSGTNLIGTVTGDLATFHIAPAPEATGGLNQLQVLGASADVNTAVSISYYTRYIGI